MGAIDLHRFDFFGRKEKMMITGNTVRICGLIAIAMFVAGSAHSQTTAPLKSYWHDGRIDYFGTATEQGQKAALTAFGYSFVRLEGYVFPTQQPGTVAL